MLDIDLKLDIVINDYEILTTKSNEALEFVKKHKHLNFYEFVDILNDSVSESMRDQDWANETTEYIFDDDSKISLNSFGEIKII